MEKVIKLIMDESKKIVISVNDEIRYSILPDNRNINAEEIFKIFDFQMGNKYRVEKENSKNVDASVIDFFYDLFEEIANRVNQIEDNES